MKMFRIFTFALTLLAVSVSNAGPQTSYSPLLRETAALSDHPLPSCGVSTSSREYERALKCAKISTYEKRPFVVQFRINDVDSTIWAAAVLLPSGRRFVLQHDSKQGHTVQKECQTFAYPLALIPIVCER